MVNIFELNDEENMRECMLNLNFMAAVTVCNDFGAQENKVCYCLYFVPICLPGSYGTGCHDLCFLNVEF